jgi:hypothetical protein
MSSPSSPEASVDPAAPTQAMSYGGYTQSVDPDAPTQIPNYDDHEDMDVDTEAPTQANFSKLCIQY